VRLLASTRSMAASSSCFCRKAHFQTSAALLLALTVGSLATTPLPLHGASSSTRSTLCSPSTWQSRSGRG